MDLKKISIQIFSIGVALIISSSIILTQSVRSQVTSPGGFNSTQTNPQTELPQTSILVTLFGITNTTDNVFVFVKVNNLTKGVFFNSSSRDISDGNQDGIVQVYMTIANQTIKSGAEYDVCSVILNSFNLGCVHNHVSPFTKTQFAQIMINDDNISSSTHELSGFNFHNPIQ